MKIFVGQFGLILSLTRLHPLPGTVHAAKETLNKYLLNRSRVNNVLGDQALHSYVFSTTLLPVGGFNC